MIESDAYRESFGPILAGAHKSASLAANNLARDPDNDGALIRVTDFEFPPEQEEIANDAELNRKLKAAREAGSLDALQWVRAWLGAAGFGGLKGNAIALAHALGSIPGATISEMAERAGVLKQTAAIAKERLQAVLPLLRLPEGKNASAIEAQQRAMRASWRKRKAKEKPDVVSAGVNLKEAKTENLGGLPT